MDKFEQNMDPDALLRKIHSLEGYARELNTLYFTALERMDARPPAIKHAEEMLIQAAVKWHTDENDSVPTQIVADAIDLLLEAQRGRQ